MAPGWSDRYKQRDEPILAKMEMVWKVEEKGTIGPKLTREGYTEEALLPQPPRGRMS